MNAAPLALTLWLLGHGTAAAGTPAAPTPPAAPVAVPPPRGIRCPSGQVCGGGCIEWTAVCTTGLADALGLPSATQTTPAVPPAGAPQGSTLLTLPRLVEATAPTMRADAPAWCTSGLADPALAAQCIGYYQLGSAGGTLTPAAVPADCPQHLRCAGVCLGEDEVCPATSPNASSRLSPYDNPEPPPIFR